MIKGRLLPLMSHDAAENMAIDESISLAVASKTQVPTLRFYQWNYPTISLGYFQSIADAEAYLRDIQGDVSAVRVVRRSTGGGAILHDSELTYSLALPLGNASPGPREKVYQAMHQTVREVLARFAVSSMPYREIARSERETAERKPNTKPAVTGLRDSVSEPFLCFQRRTEEDLICAGYKVLGSAQRRVRGGVLQHGSLLLSVSGFAPVLPGIQELTNRVIDTGSLANQLREQVGAELGFEWEPGQLSDDELRQAESISQQRYGDESWTRRR